MGYFYAQGIRIGGLIPLARVPTLSADDDLFTGSEFIFF